MQRGERRAVLDGELIERQMFGGFRNRAREFGAPGFRRLVRPRVDQIEGIALEDLARDGDRIERFLRGMQRPSAFSDASSSACTPSETRLTPAAR